MEKLVQAPHRADFAKLLIFNVQLEDFLNRQHDFQQRQRVQPEVLDEPRVFIRLGKFHGRGRGLVAFKNPEHDGRDRVEIARFAVPNRRIDCFGTAPAQSILQVGHFFVGQSYIHCETAPVRWSFVAGD